MAVVNVDVKYLENKLKMKKEKIVESLDNLGFPVEITEGKFVIEITPDRPDCLLVQGIVRAVNSFIGRKNKRYLVKKSKYKIISDKSVDGVRPHISSCVVKGLKISGDELEQLIDAQEKLHETWGRKRKKVAIGIHNLDVIEFPLKYSAVKEWDFVPLEFTEKMSIIDILSKHPKGIEFANLVEKGKYPLIYEEKSKKVVSFPPIINEDRTRLGEGTKNILIEATGTHKESVEKTVNILACSLEDFGGVVYEVKINKETHPKLEYKKEKLNLNEINKLLGSKLNKKQVKLALEKMGYFVGSKIEIPPYRTDMISYVDIIEDVAIGHGYDNFEPSLPNFYTSGKYSKNTLDERRIKEILVGMGFLEVVTPVLSNKEGRLKVLNPCSEEYSYVRGCLMDSLLKIFNENKMRGLPQKICECGVGYFDKNEKKFVVFAVMDKNTGFNQIRSIAQTFLRESGRKIKIEKEERAGFAKSGRIVENGKDVGFLGEFSEEFLRKEGLVFKISYCEIEI